MPVSKTRKLYCYVDVTGQDTLGRVYIVVVIISVYPRERLYELLERAESDSGKGKLKWHKNNTHRRDAYIEKTLHRKIPVRIYYQMFEGPELSYELTTIQATSSAIQTYVHSEKIGQYKATVIIDGLPRSQQRQVGKLLRSSGVRTKSVRGERDETNPAIRLADAVAGLLRQSYEGNSHFKIVQLDLARRGVLEELP